MMIIELDKSFKTLLIGGNIMRDTSYWTSEGVTIKDKDEERTEKVLKAVKEQGNDIKSSDNCNASYIIGSIRLKHESVMNALKLIYVVLIFSTIVNMFTAGLLIYILYRLFG